MQMSIGRRVAWGAGRRLWPAVVSKVPRRDRNLRRGDPDLPGFNRPRPRHLRTRRQGRIELARRGGGLRRADDRLRGRDPPSRAGVDRRGGAAGPVRGLAVGRARPTRGLAECGRAAGRRGVARGRLDALRGERARRRARDLVPERHALAPAPRRGAAPAGAEGARDLRPRLPARTARHRGHLRPAARQRRGQDAHRGADGHAGAHGPDGARGARQRVAAAAAGWWRYSRRCPTWRRRSTRRARSRSRSSGCSWSGW